MEQTKPVEGPMHINAWEVVPARKTIEKMGHQQPKMPMQTDNTYHRSSDVDKQYPAQVNQCHLNNQRVLVLACVGMCGHVCREEATRSRIGNKLVISWIKKWSSSGHHLVAIWLPSGCHLVAIWLPSNCHVVAEWSLVNGSDTNTYEWTRVEDRRVIAK